MAAFLDLAGFKALTVIPGEDVDEVETRYPGWIAGQLGIESARMDGKLRKRYALESPYPLIVTAWLTRIVTPLVYFKRGVDPTDEQYTDMSADARQAREEITEAANSVDGLFDLPLIEAATQTGIAKGYPQAYTEAGPYVFLDQQRSRSKSEDANGRGTTI